MPFKLHPDTKMGALSLNIRNMERSLAFYVDILGFQIREQNENTAYLGAGGDDLLILNERPDAPSIEKLAGLYHFAILVPSRLELAKSLHRLTETNTKGLGFSDHLVSEAIYLDDPDGIGIEIYRDRPRDEWRSSNGDVVMDILPLDLQNLLDELSPTDKEWRGLHPDTTIGHVHLHTGRNPEASKRFYIDQLGFDIVMSMGGYWHFISVGGYHHHLGLRPAESRKNQDSIGLVWYTIDLPDESALTDTVNHLQSTGVSVTKNGNGYHLFDHANNGILLRANSSNLT